MTRVHLSTPSPWRPQLRLLMLAMAVLWLVVQGHAAQAADTTRRVALVVGNANYTRLVALKNPRNDAADVCAALKRLGFETQCHYDLATRNDMRQAVRQFAATLTPQTTALFYFAGHAVQLRGDNHLLPVQVNVEKASDIEDDGLSLSYLLRVLEEARSAPNIVILDACRNEPFAGNGVLKLSKGLARVEPPLGSVLVYATAPGGEALDGQGRNGLFTQHLLRQIETPGQRVGELFDRVARSVEDEARTRYRFEQVPYRSFSYAGNLCLAGCEGEQLAEQMATLRQRSEAAARRIEDLERENQRLGGGASASAAQAQTSPDNQAREAELLALRNQLAALKTQTAKLEEYQRRILALERENQDKDKRLQDRDAAAKPPSRAIVVPTF